MSDLEFMSRAVELAKLGGKDVVPNPQVGCVIVKQGKVIAEGYHEIYGGPHAEVNAFNALAPEIDLSNAVVYVTLEPCAHFGKTPPCAKLIIEKKPQKVVVACLDPNPLVAGKGVEMIRTEGIEVEVGVMEKEARELNIRFFVFHEKQRPYVVLKWAETADGFVARKDYSSKWISCDESRRVVHQWRGEEQAIMVGANTAYYDNPRLNNRGEEGLDPLRVVLDWNLKVPDSHNLYQEGPKTIVYNGEMDRDAGNVELVKLKSRDTVIQDLFYDLYKRGVRSVLVEGGSWLLGEIIKKRAWDEARVFKSKALFHKGISAPLMSEKLIDSQAIGSDMLHLYVHS